MNENINSQINFLRVTIKRNLEAIGEVLSSEETSNYHNDPEYIISEINFVKVLIERNLKTVREALKTEETSNYNHEPNESDKIVETTLRANSRRNLRVELLVSKYTCEENIEYKCYLAGKVKR